MIECTTISLPTYLTVQIQEILSYGTGHFLTWASKEDWRDWFQISVQCTNQYRFCVQFPVPDSVSTKPFDAVFGQRGWEEVGLSHSLIYYLGSSHSLNALSNHGERIALQSAMAMRLLWGVTSPEEILLLGARGHRIALPERKRKIA